MVRAAKNADRHLQLHYADGEAQPVYLVGNELARGADATIHVLAGHELASHESISMTQPVVAKLYHAHRRDADRQDKLRAMMLDVPNLPPVERNGKPYLQLAWPLGLLYRGDNCVGYAMPMVDLKGAVTLDALLSEKTQRAYGLPADYRFAVQVAHSLAVAVAELHAHGYHVIDLKPANISVYKSMPLVALLDCDGFSVHSGGVSYPAHQFTADYVAPEAWRAKQRPEQLGIEQDRFALAVIIFQLLNRGLHPFQGVPGKQARRINNNQQRIAEGFYAYGAEPDRQMQPSPWSIHGHLPPTLRLLFDAAFTSESRPTAEQWLQALKVYAEPDSQQLRSCPENADHAVYAGQHCGHCAIDRQRREVAKLQKRRAPRRKVRRRQPKTLLSINSILNRGGHRSAPAGPPGLSSVVISLGQRWDNARQQWRSSGLLRFSVLIVPALVVLALFLNYPPKSWVSAQVLEPFTKLGHEQQALALVRPMHDELPAAWRGAIDANSPARMLALLAYGRPASLIPERCCEAIEVSIDGTTMPADWLPVSQRLPLQYAVATRVESETLKSLLRMGFNPDRADADGYTALDLTAWFGTVELAQLLLQFSQWPEQLPGAGLLSLAELLANGVATAEEKASLTALYESYHLLERH